MKTSQDSADSLDKATHYSFCLCNIYLHLSALSSIRVARPLRAMQWNEVTSDFQDRCDGWKKKKKEEAAKCFTIFKNYNLNEFYVH